MHIRNFRTQAPTNRTPLAKKRYSFTLSILFLGILVIVLSGKSPLSAAAQELTPPLPLVAIHVSELTQALETMTAGPNTPQPPGVPNTSGSEWWPTAWPYFVMPESLREALRSDGTPHVVVTDADITAGNLLHPDGSPKYPIVISLAAEAIRDDEIAPLRTYVNAGGVLFAGSSSFTRNPNGTTRGNFALSAELGLRTRVNSLDNWYENRVFSKATNNRIVSHIPSGTLNWRLPLSSEETPWGITPNHTPHQNHYAWAVNNIDAEILANGSAGPLIATKAYGNGRFIYYGIMQPLIGLGGFDGGMYSYLIFRQAIEWAFESANLPLVKLSPWRYAHDSAFIMRHDFENVPSLIQSIESTAQAEQAKGVKGEYYFSTGVVRLGSEDHQLTETQKQATIQSLRRAISLYGATIGSHNGGLPNPVNPTMPPSSYEYWHWGPDEALDINPPGYANGKDYANESISISYEDIEEWFSGLDNGRAGCGSANNCPRAWVSPFFNSGRDDSFDILEQLGVKMLGEQKLSPLPHWTLSTRTNGKRYTHISLPVSDWYVGNDIAQSVDDHTDASMRTGVDFYHNLGLLVNFYSHGAASNYSSYVVTKPRIWSANSIDIYDWWVLRSPVIVTPSYSQNGNTASVIATIANATDPDTAIELIIPGAGDNLQVLLNGATANSNNYRTTNYGVKVKVGNTTSTVEVRYELPPPNTPTPTPTVPPPGTIIIGETNILGTDDSGYANLLAAQQAVLPQDATIESLSFYVSSPGGQLRLGIYDNADGNPGTLRAQTTTFTPAAGWNTQNVIAPVQLLAGTYWLAFLPQSNNLQFRLDDLTGSARGTNHPFGALPTTFSSTLGTGQFHWSLYATLLVDTPITPTNTPEPTSVPSSTATATPTTSPEPPTATPTNTSLPTNTPLPPTATSTATSIPTNTPVPPTATPTNTPLPTNTPIPPTATPLASDIITIGETNILGTDDSGYANLLAAQQAVLPQDATIESLSFYVSSPGGQLRLGIYDNADGNPGTLRAQTTTFTPAAGWNTQNVIAPVQLLAGTYWLAFLPQSNNLQFRLDDLTGSARGTNHPFGALPTTFSSTLGTGQFHWSLYATLLVDTPITPTNTPEPTSVPSSTATATPTTSPEPPTATPTNTSLPTNTPLPPTATSTATSIPTNTPVPPTATPTNTPLPTNTPIPPTATPLASDIITIGETNILSTDDSGNGNLLIAQQVVLPQVATLQSLSIYITNATGQLRLGLYDDVGGTPGTLRAQTTAFTPVVGWNTQTVSTAVLLPAGTYWLAYLAQSNNLHFRVESTGSARGYSYSFGALPATFTSSPLTAEVHWSLYATLVTGTSSTDTLAMQNQPTSTIYLPLVLR